MQRQQPHSITPGRRHALWAVTSLAEPRPQRFAVPPMADPPHAMALLEPQHTLSGCLEVPALLASDPASRVVTKLSYVATSIALQRYLKTALAC